MQYWIKESDIVLRGRGRDSIPTQVLWPSGWAPWTRTDPRGSAGPEAMRPMLEPVSEAEARRVAKSRGLPDW